MWRRRWCACSPTGRREPGGWAAGGPEAPARPAGVVTIASHTRPPADRLTGRPDHGGGPAIPLLGQVAHADGGAPLRGSLGEQQRSAACACCTRRSSFHLNSPGHWPRSTRSGAAGSTTSRRPGGPSRWSRGYCATGCNGWCFRWSWPCRADRTSKRVQGAGSKRRKKVDTRSSRQIDRCRSPAREPELRPDPPDRLLEPLTGVRPRPGGLGSHPRREDRGHRFRSGDHCRHLPPAWPAPWSRPSGSRRMSPFSAIRATSVKIMYARHLPTPGTAVGRRVLGGRAAGGQRIVQPSGPVTPTAGERRNAILAHLRRVDVRRPAAPPRPVRTAVLLVCRGRGRPAGRRPTVPGCGGCVTPARLYGLRCGAYLTLTRDGWHVIGENRGGRTPKAAYLVGKARRRRSPCAPPARTRGTAPRGGPLSQRFRRSRRAGR